MSQTKLMILGASPLQLPLIQRAVERGCYVIVVSPGKDEVGKRFANIGLEADVRDFEYIYKKASEIGIDGITTDQTDITVRTVAYISEKLGLPGIGYKTAMLFTDKYLMREKCNELGIPTLAYSLCNNYEEAEDFFERLDRDAIIKPIDSQGSRGVYYIDSLRKLKEVFSQAISYSKEKKILIERFVKGREFVVEGVSVDYRFRNLMIGDTYYFNIPDVYSAFQRVFPSDAPNEIQIKIGDINKKIIEGFGLRQGITHSEYIVDGEDIFLIETAARGGGVYISSDLIPLATGLNVEDFLIDTAIGENVKINIRETMENACCYVAFYLPAGIIKEINGIQEVRELPFTWRDNFDDIKIGERTKPISDKTSRYNVSLFGKDRMELRQHVDKVRNLLSGVLVQNDSGILEGPIWE